VGASGARREAFVFGTYNDVGEWGQEAAINAAFQVSMIGPPSVTWPGEFVFDFWVGNTNAVLPGIGAPTKDVAAVAALEADMNTFFQLNNLSSAYLLATHSDGAVTGAYAVQALLTSLPIVTQAQCTAAGQTQAIGYPTNQVILVYNEQPAIDDATIATMQSALAYNYTGASRTIYNVAGSCVTFDIFWNNAYNMGDVMTYLCQPGSGAVDGEACYAEISTPGVITGGATPTTNWNPYPFANTLEPSVLAAVDLTGWGPTVHDATQSSVFQNNYTSGPLGACMANWATCGSDL
jgi:hypothetical protein